MLNLVGVIWLYLVMLAAYPQIWKPKEIFLQWSNDTFAFFFLSTECELQGCPDGCLKLLM